jgi:putative PIN family toxin of toxin-antitoxin system
LRVYLDSNVLFSASLKESSDFLALWRLHDVTLVVSQYVIDEVTRNVRTTEHEARLVNLLTQMEIISDSDVRLIPPHIELVAKDQQILATAIGASVDYLITGDKNHFSHLYLKKISHVFVLGPSHFLSLYEDRLPD